MVTFDGESLFGSGPVRFKFGPVQSRHAIQHPPGSRGTRLDCQGTEAREIKQSGVLIADSATDLQSLVQAIEGKVDGQTHLLVDNLGRTWSDIAMLRVDAEPFERVGARWKSEYRIEYLRVLS